MSEEKPAENKAQEPIPSATIVLLRESTQGMQMFMVVRHHQIDFASGALVFPGGKADPGDFDEALIPFLTQPSAEKNQRAIQVSAIREVFEECGVLLARKRGSGTLLSADEVAALQNAREPLQSGELALLDFVSQHDLELACDELVHFAHWITPTMMPKRFDTHFYLVVAPPDQLALHDGLENVDSIWATPAEVLDDAAAGRRTVIFPTLRNVEKLGQWDTIASALTATRASEVVPVLPWTEKRPDGTYLCITPDAGYLVNEEKMPERPA